MVPIMSLLMALLAHQFHHVRDVRGELPSSKPFTCPENRSFSCRKVSLYAALCLTRRPKASTFSECRFDSVS